MRNRCVLVVEDYPDARELLVEWLSGLGYETLSARNGSEALGLIDRGADPAIVFLDLRMPVMDGWTFMEIVRESHRLGGSQVWVTSAAETVEPPAGISGVLYKPLDLDEVSQICANACQEGEPSRDG
jgi:CheY-like chemotaxis protein